MFCMRAWQQFQGFLFSLTRGEHEHVFLLTWWHHRGRSRMSERDRGRANRIVKPVDPVLIAHRDDCLSTRHFIEFYWLTSTFFYLFSCGTKASNAVKHKPNQRGFLYNGQADTHTPVHAAAASAATRHSGHICSSPNPENVHKHTDTHWTHTMWSHSHNNVENQMEM